MGLTVAVAWAGSSSPAQAQTPGADNTVYIRTNAHHTFSNARFVGFNNLTWMMLSEIGPIPAGEHYSTVSLGTGSGSGAGPLFDHYTIVGWWQGTLLINGPSLVVGFDQPAAGLGRDFETVFQGFNEAQLVDALQVDGPLLDSFFSRLLVMPSTHIGINEAVPDTMLHFSQGELFGEVQASFSPIPEPVSGVTCLGALGIGLVTRRRTF